MLLRSTLNLSFGSLLGTHLERSRNHCALRHPVAVMHRCHCKSLLSNTGIYNLVSVSCGSSPVFWRVSHNSKRCICQVQSEAQVKLLSTGSHISWNGLYSSDKSPKHQRGLDGSALQRMPLALPSVTYEDEESSTEEEMLENYQMLGQTDRDEDIHMLMAEDNFNWEPKSTVVVDLTARPANEVMGTGPFNRRLYVADRLNGLGHHGGSNGKINCSIFRGDGIDKEKYYERMIGQDPYNPLLLRNYGHYLYQYKGNLEGAEKCYLFAMSLGPEDGQLLAEYAAVTWELYHNKAMTTRYFEQAVKASPEDSIVHAAYAHFLYQIGDE